MNDRLTLLLTTVGTGVLLVIAGWVLIVVARRAAAGTLTRNQFVGIRTRVTLSSDTAWRTAHAAAERDSVRGARGLMIGGTIAAASGVLPLMQIPFPIATAAFALTALGSTGWLLIWTLKGAAVGQKAVAQQGIERPPVEDER